MDVIEVLKEDHKTVAALFEAYHAAKDSDETKKGIADRVCEELAAHARLEEELFYPVVEARSDEDQDGQEAVRKAHEEHRLLKALVAELVDMKASDERLDAKMKVLKDLVEHHVEEEEGELMPRTRTLLSSEELEEMGDRIEARRAGLMAEEAQTPRQGTPRSRSTQRVATPARRSWSIKPKSNGASRARR